MLLRRCCDLSEIKKIKKRGRPVGFKLSEESRKAISKSKTGQTHTQETKDKISRSLIIYFRRKHPLSEEIINKYCRANDDELCNWVKDVSDRLDNLNDVMTDKSMYSSRRIELSCGNNIEYFGHRLTPELLLLYKEFYDKYGIDLQEFFDWMEGNRYE